MEVLEITDVYDKDTGTIGSCYLIDRTKTILTKEELSDEYRIQHLTKKGYKKNCKVILKKNKDRFGSSKTIELDTQEEQYLIKQFKELKGLQEKPNRSKMGKVLEEKERYLNNYLKHLFQ